MNDPKLTLHSLKPATAKEEFPPSSRLAIWGLPAAAFVVALLAIGIVSLNGDMIGVTAGESRLKAIIVILSAFAVIVFVHLILFATGAYTFAARLFHSETGDRSKATKPLKRDARLQHVYEELRVSHGWRWQRRLRWLLVSGTDERIDQVAPGLKQAGVMHVGQTVLVHAAPDGIEASKWLGQIRKLRRRPVDGVVHVARADDRDTGLPRKLSSIATSLGWAAPVAFLHPVAANGSSSERFDAVGAFMPDAARRQAQADAAGLPELLSEVEQWTADTGVRLHTRNSRGTWLMEISKYVGDHTAGITAHLRSLAASNWLRAPLAGVLFAPVFPGAPVVPVPVANESDDAPVDFVTAAPAAGPTREQPHALLPVWQQIAASMPNYRGRRTGLYWPDMLAWCVVTGAVVWILLSVISGLCNRALVDEAGKTAAHALAATPATPPALRAQLALQNEIATLEYRRQHGTPWYLRAGLSRNDDLLDALWQPYQTAANRNLRLPVTQALEGQLRALSQVRADEQQSRDWQQ